MRSKDKAKKIIKKKLVSLALIIIKPFIIPFLMITLLIWLCCYITDIFYIGTNEKYEKDFKSELKYYTANEYTEEEKKGFFLLNENHYVVVYDHSLNHVYMNTDILVEELPERLQTEILNMKYIEDEGELYNFLESYSS